MRVTVSTYCSLFATPTYYLLPTYLLRTYLLPTYQINIWLHEPRRPDLLVVKKLILFAKLAFSGTLLINDRTNH